MGGSRIRIDLGFCLLVLILLAWQLFLPPALSIANDNDFSKLTGRVCLGPAPVAGPTLFDYTVLDWRFSPESCVSWPFRTTVELPFRAAIVLNRLFHSETEFDLRYMGVVYSVIFLLGFITLQRALRSAPLPVSVTVQCLWILVTCNAVYVPLFNTFYFDALTVATLTGALASAGVIVLRRRVTATDLAIASLWLILLAGSKSQHSFVALIFGAALWLRAGRARFPSLALRASATALILGAAAVALGTLPRGYSGEATFNALFFRILPSVADPSAYLRETRIPASWVRFTGTHAYSPGSPLADRVAHDQFARRFGATDLIRLYMRHPSAAWVIAGINLEEASLDRVRMKTGDTEHRLGNYERSTGKPPQTLSYFFCFWPVLEHGIVANRPFLYLSYILAAAILPWVVAPPLERISLLLGMMTAALGFEWAIGMLDGADGGRHLMIFNYLLDLVVCADIVFALWGCIGKKSPAQARLIVHREPPDVIYSPEKESAHGAQ